MSIATTTQFWTTRWNGGDPLQASSYGGQDNTAFTLETSAGSDSIGSEVNGSWKITQVGGGGDVLYYNAPTSDNMTMVVSLSYDPTKIPLENTQLISILTDTHALAIWSDGTTDKLKIMGAGIVLTEGGLDLGLQGGFEAKPVIIRISISGGNKAKVYINEIIEDDLGNSKVIELDMTSNSNPSKIRWGLDAGTSNQSITYNNIYITTDGAFSPDEMSTSPFVTDSLMRMAFSIRDLLRNSKRMYLKNFVDDSSIVYGYDVSSGMVSRLAPPTIHVLLRELASPEFDTLGGTRITQNYKIILFVTTRGTDYKNAYRTGMEIGGDAFDEIYTNTGLKGDTDSLISYTATFDTKMDDDEVVCIHRFEYEYMRRLNMLHR